MSFLKPRRRLLASVTLIAALWLASGGVKTVGAVAHESYENIEVFTNILAIVQKNYVEDVTTEAADRGRHQRHADVARSAQRLPDARPLQGAAGRHARAASAGSASRSRCGTACSPSSRRSRTRRPIARGRQGGRPDHQDRRRVHQGHDAGRGREEDARPEGQQGHAHAQARGRRRRSSTCTLDARGHQDPERQVEVAREGLRLPAPHAVPGAHATTTSRRRSKRWSKQSGRDSQGSCSICATIRAGCSRRR